MTRLPRQLWLAIFVGCAAALGGLVPHAKGQQPRVRFPDGVAGENALVQFTQSPSPVAPAPLAPITPAPPAASAFGTPSNLSPQFGGGTGGFTPVPGAAAPGGASLGLPQFDPYATGAAGARPSLLQPGAPSAYGAPPPATGGSLFGPPAQPPPGGVAPTYGTPPAYAAPGYGAPGYPAPGYAAPGYGVPGYAAPGYGAPGYGAAPLVNPVPQPYYNPYPYATPYGNAPYGAAPYYTPGAGGQPNPMFPNGLFNWGTPAGTPGAPPYERLFQNSGMRYAWLRGDSGDMLQINEAEVFTTMVWHNFIFNEFPLRITPGFAVDFLEGPKPPILSDLPSSLYSAYVEFSWAPQITPNFGAQFVVRPGVHSDFDAFNTDSFRITALGLGIMQVSPEVALKLGAWYIDRNRLKLLPAGGILWTPNEQARFDFFFPSPKLSHYITTVGTWEFWGYVGGEYGGGAWTIEREEPPMAGVSERVDINDIRIFGGLEWTTARNWKGFAEVGYVFEREIVYVVVPADTVSLTDTLMLRAGLAF